MSYNKPRYYQAAISNLHPKTPGINYGQLYDSGVKKLRMGKTVNYTTSLLNHVMLYNVPIPIFAHT